MPSSPLLPLPPHDFQVLLTLAEGPVHAYGLAKRVEAQPEAGVRLEIGSLYRILARLTTLGLIETTRRPTGAAAAHEARRKVLPADPLGRRTAEAEAARLQAIVRLARRRHLVSAKGER